MSSLTMTAVTAATTTAATTMVGQKEKEEQHQHIAIMRSGGNAVWNGLVTRLWAILRLR